MRRVALPLAVTLMSGCFSSNAPTDACVPPDAPGPPAEPVFVPADGCLPLFPEERCQRVEYCPDERGATFAPYKVEVLERERVAYVEVLTGRNGLIRVTDEFGVHCSMLLRLRVGLDDLSVALIGSYCAPAGAHRKLEEEVEGGPGWTGYYLCDWSEDLDLEVRVVPGNMTTYDDGFPPDPCSSGGGCWSDERLLWIRRHSTGEVLASYALERAGGRRCTEHAVQVPRETIDDTVGGCSYREGCTVMCGGYTPCDYVSLEGRHIGPDGFCYETPLD